MRGSANARQKTVSVAFMIRDLMPAYCAHNLAGTTPEVKPGKPVYALDRQSAPTGAQLAPESARLLSSGAALPDADSQVSLLAAAPLELLVQPIDK
jgi:hypothetical protein